MRPRDTNIETAISDEERGAGFPLYSNPVCNALDRTDEPEAWWRASNISVRRVRSMRLDDCSTSYLPKRQLIDFI